MNEEKKVKYLESTVSRLETENKQLKQDKVSLELQLAGYITDYNIATQKAKDLLTMLAMSKNLTDELMSDIQKQNDKITDYICNLK